MIIYQMPKGVEHSDMSKSPLSIMVVIIYQMPKGVEHSDIHDLRERVAR